MNAGALRDAIAAGIVGRRRELDLVLAAVSAGRDILLEGTPGTSKSTILRAITASWGVPFVLVEGNAELTPARLVGHHNPARVLREDYSARAQCRPRRAVRRPPVLPAARPAPDGRRAPFAADLARLGHGRVAPVATHRDVAPALNRLLA
jgi:MoxR-like ATPase